MFTRQEKLLLFFLATIQFNHIVDFMIMMPLGPVVMRELQMTPAQFGLVISSYTFTAGIMGFLAAFFLDRFDRKRALVFLTIGFAVGTLLCSVAPSFLLLAAARSTAGAFGGVLSSVVMAIIGDAIAPDRRGTAMGIVMAGFSAASVLGVPFSLYLANLFNWHAPFVFLGTMALFMAVALSTLLPPMNAHLARKRDPPLRVVIELVSTRQTAARLLFMALLIFGQFTIIPFLSPSLVANAGLPEAQLPLVYLVGGFCTIFSSPAWGRLSDRFGYRRVALIGITISLVPFYIITNLSVIPVWLLLVIVAIMFICMGGRMIPVMTMMTSSVPPEKRGSFMSLTSSVQQLSSSIGAAVAGATVVTLSDGRLAHYDRVGLIAITSSALAVLLLYNMQSTRTVSPAPQPARTA
ncbi:MAG TPA: MFS transporter [Bdellovibrionales bacterium]|nr:MFS transporter [Bdellovibrionales bacterium]